MRIDEKIYVRPHSKQSCDSTANTHIDARTCDFLVLYSIQEAGIEAIEHFSMLQSTHDEQRDFVAATVNEPTSDLNAIHDGNKHCRPNKKAAKKAKIVRAMRASFISTGKLEFQNG